MAPTTCSLAGRAGREARTGVSARRKYSRRNWSLPQQRMTETRCVLALPSASCMRQSTLWRTERFCRIIGATAARGTEASVSTSNTGQPVASLPTEQEGISAMGWAENLPTALLPTGSGRDAKSRIRSGASLTSSPLRLQQRVPRHAGRHPDRKMGNVRADQRVRLTEVEVAYLHGETVRATHLAVTRIADVSHAVDHGVLAPLE